MIYALIGSSLMLTVTKILKRHNDRQQISITPTLVPVPTERELTHEATG